jgi:Na+/citrate or Na+/malate symporter
MNELKEKQQVKLLGFPMWMFLIMSAFMVFIAINDKMITNMVGALCFALIIGTLLGWVGDHIPVWNTWLGGGMLFTSLAAAALNTFGMIGEKSIEALNTFNGSTGFLNLYILVLITGSVLSVDRKMLVKSFAGYIPTILGGIICALALAGLVGAITGVGFMNSILDFAIPIMGGGNGAGIQPMSKMWAAAKGLDDAAASAWWATAFATISLGNLVAVFMSALLNKLGQIKPSLTGNGQLMRTSGNLKADAAPEIKIGPADYATGLALGLFCFSVATYYGKNISFINRAKLGFTVHEFAWMVILVAILNISNILPAEIRAGAKGMQMFFVKYMSFPLMITVGIGTNLSDYAKVFTNPANLLCIIATVIGAMIGTYLIGSLCKFYPVEAMLTAGLCMANGGGSGDVQCLGAANRMDMMSYAQISSRIGGAIMLVVASFFFGKFVV